ncbi:ATP-binding protein [Rhodopirellula sp. SWK7]|uniref:ATP-binding protein n=1 Tax=Rhodopirellula sp. SWK7 TaxID=595460 RepID=UPI003965655A
MKTSSGVCSNRSSLPSNKARGWGLAVCRRIIEAHEGNIDASNHPGGGTVVRIRVPQPHAN